MKSKFAPFIVAIAISGFWNHASAQNAPPPPTPSPGAPAQKPINEQTTSEAWAALQSGNYETAIAKANECIARFGKAADQIQSILETNETDLPKGAVSAADKKHIAQYQILHDVAACFLIKGSAEEKLGHKDKAKKAYAETQKYTHARVADSTGESFWSPAETASERLARL